MRSKKGYYRHGWLWLWLCCALLMPGAALASLAGISASVIGERIDHFRFSGNLKTQARYILQTSGLQVGQTITISRLEKALQELRDTDLFKDIRFQAERLENGEVTLHIIVEERHYWLLLPRLSRNSDGDIKYGIRLRMNNIQGADHSLNVLLQQEDEADGDESEELRLVYKWPMLDKPYDLYWQVNHAIEHREEEGFENVETVNYFSFRVTRDWHLAAFRTPLTVGVGAAFQDRDLDEPYPEEIEARESGQYNSLRLTLEFDDVHRERYRRYGDYYAVAYDQGFSWLGSDYDSSIVEFEVNGFRRLNRYDNFNYRVILELSNDSPFDYPNYSIGGGSSIRGLEDFDDRGDARWFANLEYVLSYRRHPQLAHTLFLDLGNVYDDLDDIDVSDVHYTLGTGFRWKLESFVKTDLFLDYGYDVEGRQGKLYGGTSLNF